MKKIAKEYILHLHSELIDEYGGIYGIRDEGLLESALNVPFRHLTVRTCFRLLLKRRGVWDMA